MLMIMQFRLWLYKKKQKTNVSRDNIDNSKEFCHISRIDIVFKKGVIFHLNWLTVSCTNGVETLVVKHNPNSSLACRQVHYSFFLIWYWIPGHYEVIIYNTVNTMTIDYEIGPNLQKQF